MSIAINRIFNLTGSRGTNEALANVGLAEPQAMANNDGDTSYMYMRARVQGVSEAKTSTAPIIQSISEATIGGVGSLTIYMVCRNQDTPTVRNAYTALYTAGEAIEYGSAETPGTSWTTFNTIYANNPWVGGAWTLAQINALEIGVKLETDQSGLGFPIRCTQVYIHVPITITNAETVSIVHGTQLKSSVGWKWQARGV